MKKSIITVLLILGVFAGFAFSQTKKRVVRRGAKTTIKKTTTPKKADMTTSNTPKSPAVTTASGLTYIITENGTGAQLKAGDTVIVHYTGLLTNGQKFDSSLDRAEPISFQLGAGRVIKGWDEALQKLRVGDRATLIIPSAIAYGESGRGSIPPNATLVFLVEIMGVQ
ncbi:MAG TPA: FKBP-type peptidyl-prolyl cis-trans isomerase [Pyrinomonadaceae bacterium]|nr:FKBP-type peptidyl-prolyl cis-trans isomerase [Pyrinomonadaceae bacterium]